MASPSDDAFEVRVQTEVKDLRASLVAERRS